jgi:hypothetical protein
MTAIFRVDGFGYSIHTRLQPEGMPVARFSAA